MSKEEPIIQKYMSCEPKTLEAGESVEAAEALMQKLKIRHLPVMKDGVLYGIVSDRDVKMALGLVGSSPQLLKLADICHEKPYQVPPDAKLHEVLDEMAGQHYGSALVVQNKKLVGIFTAIDACRAFSKVLQQRFHEH
ncbi:MAG TPA: CBS domain-containing protein [Verrucomicrobiae bacterium]|jgi:acetoin utilization protein AcuB|nr:CBS domain-containing protein [Verrucomicrobiae bacterium]